MVPTLRFIPAPAPPLTSGGLPARLSFCFSPCSPLLPGSWDRAHTPGRFRYLPGGKGKWCWGESVWVGRRLPQPSTALAHSGLGGDQNALVS